MRCIQYLSQWTAAKAVNNTGVFCLSGKSLSNETIVTSSIIGLISNGDKIYIDDENNGFILDSKPDPGFIKHLSANGIEITNWLESANGSLEEITWNDKKISNVNGKKTLEPFIKGQMLFLSNKKVIFKEYVKEFGKCSVINPYTKKHYVISCDALNRHPEKEALTNV